MSADFPTSQQRRTSSESDSLLLENQQQNRTGISRGEKGGYTESREGGEKAGGEGGRGGGREQVAKTDSNWPPFNIIDESQTNSFEFFL